MSEFQECGPASGPCPCCNLRLVRLFAQPSDEMLKDGVFPYKTKDDGYCEKWDAKLGCTVFETRPGVCRSTFVRRKFFPDESAEAFAERNRASCKILRRCL